MPARPMRRSSSDGSPDFELLEEMRGEYTLLRPTGKDSPALRDEMKRKYLDRPRRIAVDLNGLRRVGFPLLRDLHDYGVRHAEAGGRVMYVQLDPRLRPVLRLLAGAEPSEILGDETGLDGTRGEVDERLSGRLGDLLEARERILSNPLCRLVDVERCWLCPFCATVREEIRVGTFRDLPAVTLERIAEHWKRSCPNFLEKKEPWPERVLEQILENGNRQKLEKRLDRSPLAEDQLRQLRMRVQNAEEIERHVQIAVERQLRLLPAAAPAIAGGEIAIIYRPAREVSGDFYDFVRLGGGRVALVIGDVSGHGIEAGILMGMAKKVIQLRLLETDDPLAALAKANEDLFDDLGHKSFISAFLGVIDPAERTIVSARAGHVPPLLYNPAREPVSRRLLPEGPVLGVARGAVYERLLQRETVALSPGDHLLLYTDGLEEAKNDRGDEFGADRILKIVQENAESEGNMILASLALAVDAFVGGRRADDDFTALCVKIFPS